MIAKHQWLIPVILATWEAKIERIVVPGQPRQKVCKTPSQQKEIWVWWCMPVIPAMTGSLN
jgi:hypothetical protein